MSDTLDVITYSALSRIASRFTFYVSRCSHHWRVMCMAEVDGGVRQRVRQRPDSAVLFAVTREMRIASRSGSASRSRTPRL
jgi:hypothetical protein